MTLKFIKLGATKEFVRDNDFQVSKSFLKGLDMEVQFLIAAAIDKAKIREEKRLKLRHLQ